MTRSIPPKRPKLAGEPLLPEDLRYYVQLARLSLKDLRNLKERRPQEPVGRGGGNEIRLELERATNLLTVSVAWAPEGQLEAVVDYDEFMRFVRGERP